MERDTQHELKLIFVQLEAMKSINPDYVSEQDGREFNKLVNRLVHLEYDVSDFLIPDTDIFKPVSSYNSRTREVTGYRSPMVRHGVFHRKLDSLLKLFQLSQDATIVQIDQRSN